MRLRQDGHDELQVHGPSGLCANLHGLRHFVQWKHPRVFASEHSQFELPQVYEDGHVHIAALHAGGLAWPCPAWLQPRAPQTHSVSSSLHVTTQTQPRTDTAASSGVSDTSSGSTSQGDCTSPGSSESDSESDVEDVEDDIGPSAALGMRIQGFGVDQQAAFNQLDALFARRGAPGSMATQLAALDLLKRKQGHSMHSMHSRAQHSGGRSQKSPLCQLPGGAHGGESGGKAGSKQRLQAARNGGKAKPKTGWLQMQDGGNPLYSNQKSASASAGKMKQASPLGLWGYLVHLQATHQLLLLVDCPHARALPPLRNHPVFHYMQSQLNRVAGIVHLTRGSLATTGAYTKWIKSLPGQQIVLNGGNQHIFQSALRATARLNLLSPAVFPLPFGAKLLPLPPPLSKGIQEGQESDLSQEGAGKSPAGDSAATGREGCIKAGKLQSRQPPPARRHGKS
ncbi:hypothetical protein ABBQ32_000634 [Trebouxia sp. C0010 RCD-2024]